MSPEVRRRAQMTAAWLPLALAVVLAFALPAPWWLRLSLVLVAAPVSERLYEWVCSAYDRPHEEF